MSRRIVHWRAYVNRAAWLAWCVWIVSAVLTIVGVSLMFLNSARPFIGASVIVSGVLPPLTIGAMVASRRSDHPIGWMLLAMGALWAGVGSTAEYARHTLVYQPGALPGGVLIAWINSWSFALPVGVLALLVLVFPNGQLPSPRWRPVAWLVGLGLLLHVVLTALAPGPISFGNDEFLPVDNPLGFEPAGLVGTWFSFWPVILTMPPIAAVAWRFRSARGVEREQLKWLVSAAAVVPIVAPISFQFDKLTGPLPDFVSMIIGLPLWVLTVSGVPMAIGIAVLRYHLYDIDVIIRRTLVYAVLTAGLGTMYWASVIVLQQVLRPLTQGSDLAIVGSTLAVAALFQPLRSRIQHTVDRRLYRQRYNAARTLESFNARLRDELDLEALGTELLQVTRQTLQPELVSLWLRPVDRKR